VSDQTREQILRIGREEFDGARPGRPSRLINERWQAKAVAAVVQHRNGDPQGRAEYFAEANELALAGAAVTDTGTPSSDV
jgi:hypothetical protein